MDIEEHAPDFVLAAATTQPKLNDVPQYALIHEPRNTLITEPGRMSCVLAADGYLTISDSLDRFIRDLTYSTGRPQHTGFYFNTTQRQEITCDLPALFAAGTVKITYCGVNWDGNRSGTVAHLADSGVVEVFGPVRSWESLPRMVYSGELPFDGVSIQRKYAENGIGLCLLSDQPGGDLSFYGHDVAFVTCRGRTIDFGNQP